jgi:Extracellular link domain
MVEMSNLASNAARNIRNQGMGAAPAPAPVAPPTAPMNNSLVRMANSFNSQVDKLNTQVQNGFNSVSDTIRNGVTNTAKAMNLPTNIPALAAPPMTNMPKNVFGNAGLLGPLPNNKGINVFGNAGPKNNSSGGSSLTWPLGIFAVLVLTFSLLLYFFMSEIKAGYENIASAIRSALGANTAPPVPIIVNAPPPTTNTLPDSQDTPSQLQSQSIVENVLPLNGPPEVFNVSKNEFNYYDAEPLCKALGAELATYDQVKDAYGKGADWCNYGWTKGQVAVYPTQKATWDDLQKGDDADKAACGKPGVNGGYFDNPDMKFGVNCYGPKPGQSGHDEAALMKSGRIPRTISGLKIEQKVQEFEARSDELGVLPFNKSKWGSS